MPKAVVVAGRRERGGRRTLLDDNERHNRHCRVDDAAANRLSLALSLCERETTRQKCKDGQARSCQQGVYKCSRLPLSRLPLSRASTGLGVRRKNIGKDAGTYLPARAIA